VGIVWKNTAQLAVDRRRGVANQNISCSEIASVYAGMVNFRERLQKKL
jgi:hypothetical protein